jgi:H+/Cl- antiporter ClcA
LPFNSNMSFSPAGMSLGLNNLPGLGTALAGRVGDETEEERKKRMLELQQRQLLGPGGSAAASSLFGSPFGGLGGTGLLR